MEFIKENHYLFLSSKENCVRLQSLNKWNTQNIIDFLVSLHLVLEIGLNSFFRQIILMQLQKTIDKIKIAENLDCISYIDKTILFFYLPHFDFQEKIEKADYYHSAIGKLKNFSEIRNKLLHGHMVGQITYADGRTSESKTFELISEEILKDQKESFKFIMEAVSFYFDHLESSFTHKGKEDVKKFYLDAGFLDDLTLELPGMAS